MQAPTEELKTPTRLVGAVFNCAYAVRLKTATTGPGGNNLFEKSEAGSRSESEGSGLGNPSPINPRYIGTGGMQAPTEELKAPTRLVGAVFNCAYAVRLETAPTGPGGYAGRLETAPTGPGGDKEIGT